MRATNEGMIKFWVGFHRAPYVGPMRIRRLIERFGDLERAWQADARELATVLDERSLESVVKTRRDLDLDGEMERLARDDIAVLTLDDPGYPRLLAEIPAPPPVLYIKGSLVPEDEVAVATVGTRRATTYGRDVTTRIAGDLAEFGVTVVSGLARGIDAVAHQAALRTGRTIAVLGSGVNVVYPWEHRRLAEQIVAQGALISEYAPDQQPDAKNFPARNRIISGLTLGTIVVEAPARSGALITAEFAADQGREVFAVPGSVLAYTSSGANWLLRDGARPVTSADDVLLDLKLDRRQEQVAVQRALPLLDEERRLLALLTAEPQHIDELAAAANLPIAQTGALLLTMELKGLVRNAGTQHYARL